MKIEDCVGIDVSKKEIDVRIHIHRGKNQFKNKPAGFRQMLKWLRRSGLNVHALRFCAENTGLYSHQLSEFMAAERLHFSLVPALAIKRSLGIARGKDDAIDARRIAEYAFLRRHTLQDYVPLSTEMQCLKKLVALRRKLMRIKHGYKVAMDETARVLKKKDHAVYFKSHQAMINTAKKEIAHVDNAIKEVIFSHSELRNTYLLLLSIVGIGPVIAPVLIAYTNGFTRFKTWRQFACYIGIAPFPHRSGSSIQGKNKVSHLANKDIKALMYLSASTAVQHDPQHKLYYQKRLGEGKSKMSTQNIVRNKVIAIAFAVIRRQTPYVKLKTFAA